jgi:hypothetical protein
VYSDDDGEYDDDDDDDDDYDTEDCTWETFVRVEFTVGEMTCSASVRVLVL